MDDLDRLFIRLVENIRLQYPEYLTRPFEVAELYQTLIPYRHYRRELGIETNGDYEAALLRLLAGERGYLQVDPTMQEAMERELAGPNPNTALFREFAASRVSMAPDAPRLADQIAKREALGSAIGAAQAFGAGASAPPARPSPHASEPSAPAVAAPPAHAGSISAPAAAAATPSMHRTPDRAVATVPAAVDPAGAASAAGAAGRPAMPSPTPATSQRPTPQGVGGGACRYCNGTLPAGRRTIFCPHCGQNLTIQRCPACGSELETGWRFCITCGRGMTQG